jgi:hypothetical protein
VTVPLPLRVGPLPDLSAFVPCDTRTAPTGERCPRPATHAWRVTCPTPGHAWHPTCTGHVAAVAAYVNEHAGEWVCDQAHSPAPLPEPIIKWRTL